MRALQTTVKKMPHFKIFVGLNKFQNISVLEFGRSTFGFLLFFFSKHTDHYGIKSNDINNCKMQVKYHHTFTNQEFGKR